MTLLILQRSYVNIYICQNKKTKLRHMQKNIKHKHIYEHTTISQTTGFLHLCHRYSNTYLPTGYFWNNALQSFLQHEGGKKNIYINVLVLLGVRQQQERRSESWQSIRFRGGGAWNYSLSRRFKAAPVLSQAVLRLVIENSNIRQGRGVGGGGGGEGGVKLPFAEFVFAKGQKEKNWECEDR